MIRHNTTRVIAAAGLLFWASAAQGQVYVYPQNGQSEEQQQKDKAECQSWATQQTGYDPLQPPVASAPPPQQSSTGPGAVGGAARGAAVGAAVGAIAGDAGKGAAIGAAGGGLTGGMKRKRGKREHEQAQEQQAAQVQQARAQFDRAFRTCVEGRGYSVN